MIWLVPFGALCLAVALLFALLSRPLRELALDRPNDRSLHDAPVPRTGGIAILLGSLVGLMPLDEARLILILGVGLATASFVDDKVGLPVALRLLMHLGAAVWIAWATFPTQALVVAVAALAIAWMTNLYNFMDGSDGLAGTMALSGFSAYGLAAFMAGEPGWGMAFLAVASAALAFLFFNWPAARVFMGDVGSIPLGFWAAGFGLLGVAKGLWPIWFPLVVFSPFIVDATVTLARRARRGERIWRAHREHLYQRLVMSGTSKRGLALGFMCVSSSMSIWALFALHLDGPATWLNLGGMGIALSLIIWRLERVCSERAVRQ